MSCSHILGSTPFRAPVTDSYCKNRFLFLMVPIRSVYEISVIWGNTDLVGVENAHVTNFQRCWVEKRNDCICRRRRRKSRRRKRYEEYQAHVGWNLYISFSKDESAHLHIINCTASKATTFHCNGSWFRRSRLFCRKCRVYSEHMKMLKINIPLLYQYCRNTTVRLLKLHLCEKINDLQASTVELDLTEYDLKHVR